MSDTINQAISDSLAAIIDPYTQQSLTQGDSLSTLEVDDKAVKVEIQRGYPLDLVADELSGLIRASLQSLPFENRDLQVNLTQNIRSHSVQHGVDTIPGIKNIIAVASGKGGVGKSTVSANLAAALSQAGANVAVLDADIYGPSQPRMMGVTGKPDTVDNKKLLPLSAGSIKVMSIGFMVEEDTPMIWRGPMVTQALEQMLRGTKWDHDGREVDYMIVDLPPGTGDIQLTMSQRVPVTGAVIVTTPQDIALLDARKAVKMFEKVKVPILGVIENMSTHICSQCGHEEPIFGADGAAKMAQEYNLKLLGRLPLQLAIREQGDIGKPIVLAQPDSDAAKKCLQFALNIAADLSTRRKEFTAVFPKIVVEHN